MPNSTTACPTLPAGFGKRVHAWMLAHCGARYERMVAERKRGLFAGLRGDILEIGPGAGPNLGYYPKSCRWVGVEPNPFMHRYLREAAARAGLSIDIRTMVAETLPAEDQGMDAVVSTLVLCSVQDPAMVLREILRVLKPGGRFVFLEHVAAAEGTRLRKVQRIIRPVWRRLTDGCHPDRETGPMIEVAGFAQVQYDSFRLPLGPVATQIAGWAIQ
ncbi:MAG: class I SAM-dependent methyltransferase [Acidobacteria bacterium]|nr:class I SAM-dependent methyltransferase [Acidobacteriota bacterium]